MFAANLVDSRVRLQTMIITARGRIFCGKKEIFLQNLQYR